VRGGTADWDELSDVVDIISRKGLTRYLFITPDTFGAAIPPKGLGPLAIMLYISSLRISRTPLSLQKLLLFSRSFEGTDSRDLKFGLLGVAPEV